LEPESKPIGKLEIPETMVKTFSGAIHPKKFRWLVTSLSIIVALEFALFRHQKCPRSAATNDW
jgi:hypothetical protein